MSVRRTRRWLWLMSLVFTAGAVGVIHQAWQEVNKPPVIDDRAVEINRRDTGPEPIPAIELAALRPLWALDLGQTLFDPPPVVVEEPKFVPPPLRLQLLGTVIEPDNEQAIVMTSQNRVVFARVGQELENAVIRSITESRIEVAYYDETRTIHVQAD